MCVVLRWTEEKDSMEGLMRALRGIRGSGYNYDILEGPGGRQRQRAGGEREGGRREERMRGRERGRKRMRREGE